MAGPSFKAVVANGFVHLTVHNPDHPDTTIRMLATELPHLLEALAAVAEVPATAHHEDAVDGAEHAHAAHEEKPPHEDDPPAPEAP